MTIPQYTLLPMVVAQTDLIATVPGPVAAHFAAHHGLLPAAAAGPAADARAVLARALHQ
jgi:hypothetical protein